MTETLTWTPVADRLPDDGLSVLICTTGTDEPVWVGYLDGAQWRDSEGAAVEVVAWAEMPRGREAMPTISSLPPMVPYVPPAVVVRRPGSDHSHIPSLAGGRLIRRSA